jgi:flagellar biosynthetic protein FliO
MNSGSTKRRLIPALVVLLLAAVIGLVAIDAGDVTAQRGADRTTESAQSPKPSQDFDIDAPVGSIVKMLSALVIVVFCIYVGLYLLKRMMTARYRSGSGRQLLEVIESTHVGPKKIVSLVRVGDRSVLVGVTDQQITVLTELTSDETGLLLTTEAESVERESFSSLVRSAGDRLRRFGFKRSAVTQEG